MLFRILAFLQLTHKKNTMKNKRKCMKCFMSVVKARAEIQYIVKDADLSYVPCPKSFVISLACYFLHFFYNCYFLHFSPQRKREQHDFCAGAGNYHNDDYMKINSDSMKINSCKMNAMQKITVSTILCILTFAFFSCFLVSSDHGELEL